MQIRILFSRVLPVNTLNRPLKSIDLPLNGCIRPCILTSQQVLVPPKHFVSGRPCALRDNRTFHQVQFFGGGSSPTSDRPMLLNGAYLSIQYQQTGLQNDIYHNIVVTKKPSVDSGRKWHHLMQDEIQCGYII